MDTHMYTFTTTTSWIEYETNFEDDYENDYKNDYAKDYEGDYEDYEDDFDLDNYKATNNSATIVADFRLLQHIPAVVAFGNKQKARHSNIPVARKSTFDYTSVNPDHWPSLARAVKALWNDDGLRRPAYVEMSYNREGGFACPYKRIDYSSNWLRIKKAMGFNMKLPAMIRSSPLQKSMTWEEDSKGDYIKETGFHFLQTCPPALYYDSHSDEEQDESQSPLGSPFMESFYEKGQVDKYNAVTTTIDINSNDEDFEIRTSSEFADFNQISDNLDIKDILGYSERYKQQKHINETTVCGKAISFYKTEDMIRPTKQFWDKEITAAGGVRHDQVGECIQEEALKPIPCVFPGIRVPYTPSGSTSSIDLHIEEKIIDSSAALKDSNVYGDPVLDPVAVNNMAHSLVRGDNSVRKVTKSLRTVPCAKSRINNETSNMNNTNLELIGFVKKAQATVELDTTMAEATHIILPNLRPQIDDSDYIQSHDYDNCGGAPRDSALLAGFLPDLRSIKESMSTSIVRNMAPASRFALPSVPWGRLVSTADALVNMIGSVTRQ